MSLGRRDFLRCSSALGLTPLISFQASAEERPDATQLAWVLEELANRHQGSANIPPTVIVDKVNGKAYIFDQGQELFSVDIIVGRSRRDDITTDGDVSVFDQEVTPAGVFDSVQVTYDPEVGENYHRKMLATFMDVQNYNGSQELLAFHSVLGIQDDEANLSDGNPENNNLSNGCVRMSQDDLDRFLEFLLTPDRQSFLENAPLRETFSYMPSDVSVIIMPEEDTSRENTLNRTVFAVVPSQNQSFQRSLADRVLSIFN